MSHILDEIIEMIVKPIGDPDRNILLPFLLVCRRFYKITVPLLYESVSAAFPKSSYRPRPYDTPLTTVAPECFALLHQSITENPSLGVHISAVLIHGLSHTTGPDWESFRSILSSSTHLRRLYVWGSFGQSPGIELLPPTVRLTHLVLKIYWDESTLDFIRSQTSLEYLTLGTLSHDQQERCSTFRSLTLSILKTLECDSHFFKKLTAPRLQHLSMLHMDPEDIRAASFRPIQSFMGPDFIWRQCAPYCDNIEYVWVQSTYDTFIKDTLKISSRKVKYIHHVPIHVDDVDCSVLFNAFPELVIVDLDGNELGGFRYRRGCAEPEEFEIPHLDKVDFRHWCELVVDVVEEEIRKNGRTPS